MTNFVLPFLLLAYFFFARILIGIRKWSKKGEANIKICLFVNFKLNTNIHAQEGKKTFFFTFHNVERKGKKAKNEKKISRDTGITAYSGIYILNCSLNEHEKKARSTQQATATTNPKVSLISSVEWKSSDNKKMSNISLIWWKNDNKAVANAIPYWIWRQRQRRR